MHNELIYVENISDILWRHFEAQLDKILMAAIVFIATIIVAFIVKRLVFRMSVRKFKEQPILLEFLQNLGFRTTLLIGFTCVLGTLGVHVEALIASLGITGLAIGLAFKDFFSNMLAGLTMMFHDAYSIGDEVTLENFKGKIIKINLRHTVLDAGENTVIVPNGLFFSSVVVVKK